jgi:hypothetical protein
MLKRSGRWVLANSRDGNVAAVYTCIFTRPLTIQNNICLSTVDLCALERMNYDELTGQVQELLADFQLIEPPVG